MAVHTPLPENERVRLSPGKWAFLKEKVNSKSFNAGLTKATAIMAIMIGTPRPSAPGQCILDQVFLGEKMHDREPGLVIKGVEERFGADFFATLPRQKKDQQPSIKHKSEFISEYASHLRGGAKFGKPELRKDAGDVPQIN
jgi:hypothetical protein